MAAENVERKKPSRPTLLIVGNGMVSWKFCDRLADLGLTQTHRVIVFGDEPRPAYDRVQLTKYFTLDSPDELSLGGAGWYADRNVELRVNALVTAIDRGAKTITTAGGESFNYDVLVLASGSSAFVPPVPGVKQDGVFVYRTIEDLEAIALQAKTSRSAAVIGGGLLGLEAARAVQLKSLETHVVELAPRLMPRQLDAAGSKLLERVIRKMGVELHLGKVTKEFTGDGVVNGIRFDDDSQLDVDMIVISAGIKPRDELARLSNLEVGPRGGIVVNDHMCTSDPTIYAIGECALHRGMVYGLVAPGYEMADVLAKRLSGTDVSFVGADMSAKLKLLGTDVASLGDPFAETELTSTIVYQDYVKGVYKKLLISESGKKLLGAVLVGDASEYAELLHMTRSGEDIPTPPESLILGVRGEGAKKELPDTMQVCSCNNVSKGDICTRIREDGLITLGEVKSCTKAATSCGGCLPMVTDILNAELKKAGKAQKPRLCEHFDFTRQELFQIVSVRGIRTFDELIAGHGTGHGCEICKPTVASILASTHNAMILEHATLQDTNDRFLANIQRQGTYSVVPRVPGGEITPEKLIVLGQVAKKYGLYTKITGGQRIDLFGAHVGQLPEIWEELVNAGFESGHAYGKALRTVKSCVGSTWCRYGVQDSVGFAIAVEERYKGLRAPHKIKSAVSGCVRECAEAQSKDFGIIATEKGWNLYVCGNGGAKPRHADLIASDIDSATCLKYIDRFLMFYIRTADRLTRTSVWLDKLEGGLDHLKAVILDDSLGICAELEKQMQALVDTYQCEWTAVVNDPARRAQFRHFANTAAADPTITMTPARKQQHPSEWPKQPVVKGQLRKLPIVRTEWVPTVGVADVPIDGGVAVQYGSVQLAVYNFASRGEWYATQNNCPHKGDQVLARGIVGDQGGVPKVACPMHKKSFSLQDGGCLSGDDLQIRTFPVRIDNGMVYVELPPRAELERDLCEAATCHADAAE